MRKIVKIVFLTISVAIANSCSEDSIISNRSSFQMLKMLDQTSFDKTIERVLVMNKQQLDEWEKERGFISFRTALARAYNEIETIQSQEELISFIERNKKVLWLNDKLVMPRITIPLYQAIANEEGMYQTDEFVNKIYGDYVFTVKENHLENLRSLDIEKAIANLVERGQRPINVIINRISGIDSESSLARVSGTCTTNISASYFYNQSNCKNDREVVLTAKSYIVFSSSSEGDWRQPRVSVEVVASRRAATFCYWYLYDTYINRRNISFSILAWSNASNGSYSSQRFDINVPNASTQVDSYHLLWDYAIGSKVLNQLISAQPFISFYGEATHRGVNGNWVVLNCN